MSRSPRRVRIRVPGPGGAQILDGHWQPTPSPRAQSPALHRVVSPQHRVSSAPFLSRVICTRPSSSPGRTPFCFPPGCRPFPQVSLPLPPGRRPVPPSLPSAPSRLQTCPSESPSRMQAADTPLLVSLRDADCTPAPPSLPAGCGVQTRPSKSPSAARHGIVGMEDVAPPRCHLQPDPRALSMTWLGVSVGHGASRLEKSR